MSNIDITPEPHALVKTRLLWASGNNTADIASVLMIPEPTIERWVWEIIEEKRAA